MAISRILPLEGRILHLILDGLKLAICILGDPEVPDIIMHCGKDWIVGKAFKPLRELREVLLLVEHLWPREDSWKHVLHEDASGIPSQISMGEAVTSHIRRCRHLFLKPRQLLPHLSELRCASRTVHGALCACMLRLVRRQIHRPLGVRKVRLRTVRRGNVEVVNAAHQVDACTIFRRIQNKARPLVSKAVFEITHDDPALEEVCLAILEQKSGNLLQRVHLQVFGTL
mmetsp:Transcript_59032/g.140989  ORF Transcript_59032/g.140989 Transcript_59032/m.140989 type:complete len:228 (+) Transcript_59032:344-1027(+)